MTTMLHFNINQECIFKHTFVDGYTAQIDIRQEIISRLYNDDINDDINDENQTLPLSSIFTERSLGNLIGYDSYIERTDEIYIVTYIFKFDISINEADVSVDPNTFKVEQILYSFRNKLNEMFELPKIHAWVVREVPNTLIFNKDGTLGLGINKFLVCDDPCYIDEVYCVTYIGDTDLERILTTLNKYIDSIGIFRTQSGEKMALNDYDAGIFHIVNHSDIFVVKNVLLNDGVVVLPES